MLEYIALIIGGIIIGFMGVTLGGSMFVSIPFLQILFPGLNYGQTIGNLKIGSFARSLASTISTWKQIQFKEIATFVPPFIIGSIIGSASIAKLDQKYLIVAVISAIILSELSPHLARFINKKTRFIASIFLGIYTGFIGAGISILLVALLRTIFPKNEQIIFVKIQARFIEATGTIAAIITHIYYGNIIFPIWLLWSIGTFIGGYIGGIVLKRTTKIKPKYQRIYLVAVYIIAIIPLIIKLL